MATFTGNGVIVSVDLGAGTDAAVQPGVSGSLHAHIREAQENIDTVKTDTAAILVDTGDGTDAAVQPGVAGSLHAHVREAQENIDTLATTFGAPAGASLAADIAAVKADTAALLVDTGDGTDVAVAAGSAGSLHGHIREVQDNCDAIETDTQDIQTKIGSPAGASLSADVAAVKAETAALLVDTGDGTDVAVAPGSAGSLHAHIREVQDNCDAIETDTQDIQTKIGSPAGASVSADVAAIKAETAALLVDTGDGTDAEVAPGSAGSLHAHIREAQANIDAVETDTQDIQTRCGAGTDAAVQPSVAGSLHGHIREVQDNCDAIETDTQDIQTKIGSPAGASVSADIAAIKAETAALLVDTGDGTDAEVAPGSAGSLHAHIREAQANIDAVETDTQDIQTKIGAPAGASVSADVAAVKAETAALLVDTGDGTDSPVAPGTAGSLHGHIREVQANCDAIETDTQDIQSKIGTPAGASVSADIAAIKSDTGTLTTAKHRLTYDASLVVPASVITATTDTRETTSSNPTTSATYKIIHLVEHTPPASSTWKDMLVYLHFYSQGTDGGGGGTGNIKWGMAPSTNVDAAGDTPSGDVVDFTAEVSVTTVKTEHEVTGFVHDAALPASGKVRFMMLGKAGTGGDTMTGFIRADTVLSCTVEV